MCGCVYIWVDHLHDSIGFFLNPVSCLRLVKVYLMECSGDWSVTWSYLSKESIKSLGEQAT